MLLQKINVDLRVYDAHLALVHTDKNQPEINVNPTLIYVVVCFCNVASTFQRCRRNVGKNGKNYTDLTLKYQETSFKTEQKLLIYVEKTNGCIILNYF